MPDADALTCEQAQARLMGLPAGATVLLLGGTDTGKTTFALAAATALAQAGRSVALLDGDLGQSEIGPPGTVAAALAAPGGPDPIRSGRDLETLAAYFVGATSPARHLLETAVGLCQMARVAKKRRPALLLADTAGWVQGPAARQLARRLAELLLPQTVLAFARGDEVDPLLSVFAHLKSPEVRRVTPAEGVVRKSPAVRATRRAARFAAALEGASEITLRLDDVALWGTELGQGEPLPHHLQQFVAGSLGVPVLYAARPTGGRLYVVVDGGRWNAGGLAAIEGHFQVRATTIVPAERFAGLLVGLVSDRGALLDVGLIARLDFARRALTLHTPCRRPAAIAQVWCGSVRLRPDGLELGQIKPGEL
ncbi:MAG: hypothetical protein JO250_06685 [Armatimonadetes bacterium]|nr:hypothetical protein [Armatimonadota bacterium]